MLTKTLSGLLLFLFLFNYAGAGLLSVFLLNEHREERTHCKNDSDATFLTVTADPENRKKFLKGHEMVLNGKRFDISNVSVNGNFLVVTLHPDSTEDEMLSALEQETSSKSEKQKTSGQKKFAPEYLPVVHLSISSPVSDFLTGKSPVSLIHSLRPSPGSPPPWTIC